MRLGPESDIQQLPEMFVADRVDEVLHVIVAFARVGTPDLQIATCFRFIDLSEMPLGFLVVEHLGYENHVTRFGVEETRTPEDVDRVLAPGSGTVSATRSHSVSASSR